MTPQQIERKIDWYLRYNEVKPYNVKWAGLFQDSRILKDVDGAHTGAMFFPNVKGVIIWSTHACKDHIRAQADVYFERSWQDWQSGPSTVKYRQKKVKKWLTEHKHLLL